MIQKIEVGNKQIYSANLQLGGLNFHNFKNLSIRQLRKLNHSFQNRTSDTPSIKNNSVNTLNLIRLCEYTCSKINNPRIIWAEEIIDK